MRRRRCIKSLDSGPESQKSLLSGILLKRTSHSGMQNRITRNTLLSRLWRIKPPGKPDKYGETLPVQLKRMTLKLPDGIKVPSRLDSARCARRKILWGGL